MDVLRSAPDSQPTTQKPLLRLLCSSPATTWAPGSNSRQQIWGALYSLGNIPIVNKSTLKQGPEWVPAHPLLQAQGRVPGRGRVGGCDSHLVLAHELGLRLTHPCCGHTCGLCLLMRAWLHQLPREGAVGVRAVLGTHPVSGLWLLCAAQTGSTEPGFLWTRALEWQRARDMRGCCWSPWTEKGPGTSRAWALDRGRRKAGQACVLGLDGSPQGHCPCAGCTDLFQLFVIASLFYLQDCPVHS